MYTGGYIVNVMREHITRAPWYEEGLDVYMDQLEKEGLWRKVSRTIVPDYAELESGESVDGVVHIYQTL